MITTTITTLNIIMTGIRIMRVEKSSISIKIHSSTCVTNQSQQQRSLICQIHEQQRI